MSRVETVFRVALTVNPRGYISPAHIFRRRLGGDLYTPKGVTDVCQKLRQRLLRQKRSRSLIVYDIPRTSNEMSLLRDSGFTTILLDEHHIRTESRDNFDYIVDMTVCRGEIVQEIERIASKIEREHINFDIYPPILAVKDPELLSICGY